MARKHNAALDLSLNEVLNVLIQNLSADPTGTESRFYYNTISKTLKYYNGTVWVSLGTTSYTTENAQDDIAAAFAAGTQSGLTITYDDANNKFSFTVTGVAPSAITFAATDKLLGRDTAAGGPGEEIGVTGGIVFDGAGNIQTTAFTGDVTKTLGGTALTIANDAVTYAKIQNVTTDRLLGRDTAGSGDTEEITVGGGIEFTGTTGIQTSAFTGDVTKTAGGTALTIPNNTVTFAKMQDIATDRLIGRDTAATGDPEEVALDTTLVWTGGPGIGRAAISGDITISAGSNTSAITSSVIVDGDVNASAAIAATKLGFSPTGNISSTTVQAAIAELETDLTALINSTVEGQKWKDPVDAATTTVLPNTPTYSAGAGTLTAGANAAFPTIDGVTAVAGHDYLVKDQASSFQDGIYTLTTLGSGAAPWVLTRRADGSTATELQDAAVHVEAGTVNIGRVYTQTNQTLADLTAATQTWTLTNQNQVYTADTTTITLTANQFSVTAGGITGTQLAASVAGNGLAGGAGSALSVNTDTTTIEISGDALRISATAAGAGLIGGGASALAVGAGTGILSNANDVAIDTTVVVRKFTGTLTGGATSEVITHNLNTRGVVVRIYLTAGTFAEEEFEVEHTSVNTVTVRFSPGNIPGSTYSFVILG